MPEQTESRGVREPRRFADDPGDSLDVQPGDVWQVGEHILAAGDLERGDARRLLEFVGENPTLSYVDPPWNQGQATRFRHQGGAEGETKFRQLLGEVIEAVHYASHSALVEMGVREWPTLRQLIRDHGGLLCDVYGITYDRKNAAVLARASWTTSGQTSVRSPDLEGADDAVTPGLAIAFWTQPDDLVFDPCLGRGLTAIEADRIGRRCVGLELNPRRVAVAVSKLAHSERPARKIATLEGGRG